MLLQHQTLITHSSLPSPTHHHLHLQNPIFSPHASLIVSRWNGARRNRRMKVLASQVGDSNASVKKKSFYILLHWVDSGLLLQEMLVKKTLNIWVTFCNLGSDCVEIPIVVLCVWVFVMSLIAMTGLMKRCGACICLLKAKNDLSDDDEKNMLDFLYTVQYYMRGIIAVSLGRISNDNVENYTHAVFMRFQRKEDVAKFYENPFYLKVLKEHVFPYCHGLINVDYESEVEDDILHIFRKGEDFNFGVEYAHLIAFRESAYGAPVEDALASLEKLTEEFPSLIAQSTQGSNFNPSSDEYTHAVVTRCRSLEAFNIFMSSTQYKDVWRSKFGAITKKTLPIHFSVDPVGKEIM